MNITFNELLEQARTYFFENKTTLNLIKLNNNIIKYCKENNKDYKDVNNEIYLNLVYLN